MPRAGLTTKSVVACAAEIADEDGIEAVSIAAVAERLGVKAPALYKHVDGIDDLRRHIATLAMTELGEALRDALQGRSQSRAINALFTTLQTYARTHPGRYSATTGAEFRGDDDPLFIAAVRVIESVRAVLTGYGIAPADLDHAIRMLRCLIHGYALLQASDAFQWSNDPDQSVSWMIDFIDAGLTAVVARESDRPQAR